MKSIERTISPIWQGIQEFSISLEEQKRLHQNALQSSEDFILGQEHPNVITLGKRGRKEEDLLQKNLPVFEIDRGGQATLHSPGQLVIYPILKINSYGLGVRAFIDLILEVSQRTLATMGCQTSRLPEGVGLATDRGKIVFVGLRVSQGVTSHGLAINVSNNLELFKQIRPCGVSAQAMDSLEFYGQQTCRQVFEAWMIQFRELIPASK